MYFAILPLTCRRWLLQRPLAVRRMNWGVRVTRGAVCARLFPRGLPLLHWCFSATQWRFSPSGSGDRKESRCSSHPAIVEDNWVVLDSWEAPPIYSTAVWPQIFSNLLMKRFGGISSNFCVFNRSLADFMWFRFNLPLWGNMSQINQRG